MRIKLSPARMDGTLSLQRMGAASLRINGDTLDLSSVPDGATIEDAGGLHPMLAGNIEMTDDGPEITVILPLGPNPSQAQCFPADIVDPPLGIIALPQPEDQSEEI